MSDIYIPNQGVNLGCSNLVHALHSLGNLALVALKVNNEHQSIVVLNLLHCRLSGQGELENRVLIQLVSGRYRFSGVKWFAYTSLGLGAIEVGGIP